MPNSFRIRTQLGANRTIPVKLDQDYDKLEILSLAIYPNNVYTRSCADYGVLCGRVFANKGYGIVNARVSIFIPISPEDESNPIVSTLYPYKGFDDFNEDGYKYNLLPYTPSHSGHVAVGTFPERIDALTNPTVIEVYDKYYKFTAKTNDAGDYMIFGLPLGQHDIFMQVDLSDIGEFSLTPQDLIRMGRATEAQVNGTKFKFSENYSELPQIVTLTKIVQIQPFFGQDGVCQHYITRADFDLTSEGGIEFQPTAVFIGSMFSSTDKKKLKKRCRVPAKQGWLCNMIAGPGQIETIRQTIFTDNLGRPVLENFKLQNDGKLIDENGTWMVELPMNLDYVYTDENGVRRISPDGKVGVPVRGKYRFKIKWQQSPSLSEENRRAYFLVPNIKEYGWNDTNMDNPADDPGGNNSVENTPKLTIDLPIEVPAEGEQANLGPYEVQITPTNDDYYNVINTNNLESYVILVDGVERPEYYNTIPMPLLAANVVEIKYYIIDATVEDTTITFDVLNTSQFTMQSSYAFSVSWEDYGDSEMINEAINCQDRFYEFQYNKVYTISQLLDRYTNRIFPQKSIQVKHILDDTCEGDYNTFPTNDVYYRYNLLYILANVLLTILKFSFFQILIFLHVLAFLWPIFAVVLTIVWAIQKLIYWICNSLRKLGIRDKECKEPQPLSDLLKNPFKNVRLPLFLYTEDGCERCRCKVVDQELDESNNTIAFQLNQNLEQLEEGNISYLADLNTNAGYPDYMEHAAVAFGRLGSAFRGTGPGTGQIFNDEEYQDGLRAAVLGNSAADPLIRKVTFWRGAIGNANVDLFSTTLSPAERLNLFNTKAKYFDNVSSHFITNGDTYSDQSPSPGNIGWNQAKVTINPPANNSNDFYHFDNMIIVLVDSTGFTKGDILTFQDPAMSTDSNYNSNLLGTGTFSGTTATKLNPGEVTIKYANPDISSPTPLLSMTYDMTGAYIGERPPARVTGATSCYPTDIEYFQVIDERLFSEYLCVTATGGVYCEVPGFDTPGNSSQRRFSLAWRFLRSNRAFSSPLSNNVSDWFNASLVSRSYNGQTPNCLQICWNETTHNVGHIDTWELFLRENPNTRILFLQRGVDINSPGVPMKFDLRRFYGVEADYDSPPIINGVNISSTCVVQGRYKVNQPILPGGTSLTSGFDINRTCGFAYEGYISAFTPAGLPVYNTDTRCQAVIETNLVISDGATVYPNLVESPTPPDTNNIFENSALRPPSDSTARIRIFLKFESEVDDPEGLRLQFLKLDNTPGATSIVVNTFPITIGENTINQTFNVSGFEVDPTIRYELGFVNLSSGNITLLADIPSWVTDNPNGLKLPKHHLITDNNSQQIYFPSQFFQYESNYISYDTTMPTFYSALDTEAIQYGWVDGERWRTDATFNLEDGVYGQETYNFLTISVDNWYYRSMGVQTGSDGFLYVPCSRSTLGLADSGGFENSYVCGDALQDPEAGGQNYVCDSNDRWDSDDNGRFTQCPGCCRYRANLYDDYLTYHSAPRNIDRNNVGGYWGREYVEGGSAPANTFKNTRTSDTYQRVYSTTYNCQYEDPQGDPPQWGPIEFAAGPPPDNTPGEGPYLSGGGNCEGSQNNHPTQVRNWTWISAQYISPVYAAFPNVPSPGIPENLWYVNPNHYVTMSNSFNQVMRTDRLPSSTSVQTDGNGNGYLLHQNGGFAIFKINTDCTFEQQGGGDLPTPEFTADIDYDILGGADSPLGNVAASLTDCTKAVDLNSYYTDTEENPQIQPGGNGYSSEPASGADWLWFVRGVGCYNIVSKPFRSLFFHPIPEEGAGVGSPNGKQYSDFATVVEWIQRLKLTFSLCFDVYSHTFSNNWINGTLYAFPFQNATTFNSQNKPVRAFCRDTIYFHDPLNNYYYRSSPWNGTDFIGRPRYSSSETKIYGNVRNLLFPTTIIDMGPKTSFIQEIVYSDDYDGYIVPRIPSTTFQDVTDILNLFILSRLVNTSFIQQLFPLPDASGNEQGGDDPSVGAFFKNSRWQNGELFSAGLLPGLVDADYSQLISINSEFGVNEFSPENYTNDDLIFAEDTVTPTYPYFGIFLSGDNQMRDYISPRRTIWNQNAPIPAADADFTEIAVKTQVVPFYQWNVFHNLDSPPSLFGTQSNNFITEFNSGLYTNSSTFPNGFFSHGYQTLDRFGLTSEYFAPGLNNTFYYKGYLINYSAGTDADGNVVVIPVNRIPDSARFRYTFGAPFHFYFGLKQGASAMDRFIQKYVDTNIVYE